MGNLKKYKIIGIILTILSILSVGCSIYSIYLLSSIETFYRIMISCFLAIALITLLVRLVECIKFYKIKGFIVTSIIMLILTIISVVISVVILVVLNKLDNMNKQELKYKTVLISLEKQEKIEDLKDIKIGIVENTEDTEGYILPQEVIKKYSLDKSTEIVNYEDTIALMTAFINKEVDAIFISSNYKAMLKNIETFKEDTKIYEIYTYEKAYQKKKVEKEETLTSDRITKPFTVLLLGVDSEEEGISSSSYNGDTIMLISVDPETLHATMFSIPRDTYVPMACGGNQTKITHAAWGGTSCMVKTVENFTGLSIDYYVKINFQGVVSLVDILGGITVDVPMDFCESNSHRWADEWEICLNKGVQTLGGEQALALARHRKTLPLGDFQRGQNQQLVVEGMINKIKTVRSVNDFYKILDTISNNIDTNMSRETMLSFYNVAKNILTKEEDVNINITKTFLTGYDLYVYEGYDYTYTFQYYKQSLNSIINAMKVNLGLIEPTIIKTFNFSMNSPYEKEIIGYTYYGEARRSLVPDFTAYSLTDANNWGSSHGITINVNYVDSSDSNYTDGQIISQSVHEGVLVDKVGSITIDVIRKKATTKPDENEEEEKPTTPTTPTKPETKPNEGSSEDDPSNPSTGSNPPSTETGGESSEEPGTTPGGSSSGSGEEEPGGEETGTD